MVRFSRGEGPPGGIERRTNVLTHEDREWIAQAITEHACNFTPEEVRANKKMLDILVPAGNGDLNRGVERFREQNKFLDAVLTKRAFVAGAMLVALSGAGAIALAAWLWAAVKMSWGK
jgi:hypothetical protein